MSDPTNTNNCTIDHLDEALGYEQAGDQARAEGNDNAEMFYDMAAAEHVEAARCTGSHTRTGEAQ